MSTPKVVYIPEQAGSVTLHLTVDEACLVRALIGATAMIEHKTRSLFDALVRAGIPKKYKVVENGKEIYGFMFEECE